MTDRPPPEDAAARPGDNERVKRLKQASRLIVTTREKMPHSAQWHLSLRRTLWRYTQEVLLHRSGSQPAQANTMEQEREEKDHDS
jgi:hypothetical protein